MTSISLAYIAKFICHKSISRGGKWALLCPNKSMITRTSVNNYWIRRYLFILWCILRTKQLAFKITLMNLLQIYSDSITTSNSLESTTNQCMAGDYEPLVWEVNRSNQSVWYKMMVLTLFPLFKFSFMFNYFVCKLVFKAHWRCFMVWRTFTKHFINTANDNNILM